MSRTVAGSVLVLGLVAICLVSAFGLAWAETVKLPEVAVTATRSERPLEKLPRNVTVITAEEIARLSPLTVTDLLKAVPGVVVRDYTGTGALASVDLRGFGETAGQHTLVLVDGRRLNQIDLSGVDFTNIPVENIERIEILHGPAGVLYGDSAVGGVINIITKKGKGAPGGRLQSTYGSWQTWGGRGYFQGTSGRLGWFVSARHDSTEGYRENSETRLRNLTFNTTYDAAGGLSLLVDGALGQSNYSLPGGLSEEQYNQDRRQSVQDNSWGEKKLGFLRGRLRKDFGPAGVLTADVAYRRQESNSRWYSDRDTEINTYSFLPKYVWSTGLNGMTNRLTLGVDLYYVDMTTDKSQVGGPKTETTDYQVTSVGPYFLDELELTPQLTLSFGARYQTADYSIDIKPVGGTSSSYSPSDDQWAASLGLTYNPRPKMKLYGRVSRAFRYPTVEEYVTWGSFNPSLKPEKVWNYEIGGEYTFMPGGRVSVALYLLKLKDEIAYNKDTYLNENLEDTEHKGLEASLVVPVHKRVSLFGGVTYEEAKFTAGTYDGNDLPLVPNWKLSAGATVEPIDRLVATLQVTYVGERPYGNDKANAFPKMDAYTTVDLNLSYTWQRWRFFLNGTNLLGEKYADYAYAGSWGKSYYPAPEATVWGGVAVSF